MQMLPSISVLSVCRRVIPMYYVSTCQVGDTNVRVVGSRCSRRISGSHGVVMTGNYNKRVRSCAGWLGRHWYNSERVERRYLVSAGSTQRRGR